MRVGYAKIRKNKKVRKNHEFSMNCSLSVDDCCSENSNCNGGRCSLPHRVPCISESMFIATSMVDHGEEIYSLKLYKIADKTLLSNVSTMESNTACLMQ